MWTLEGSVVRGGSAKAVDCEEGTTTLAVVGQARDEAGTQSGTRRREKKNVGFDSRRAGARRQKARLEMVLESGCQEAREDETRRRFLL